MDRRFVTGRSYPGDNEPKDVGLLDARCADIPEEQQLQDGEKDAGDGWTWQAVADELEALRRNGEQYTSQEKLGKKIGCSGWLIGQAIRKGPVELLRWRVESKHRGASRLNVSPEAAAVAFDGTPQGREPDPADIADPDDLQRTMELLIEQAGKRHGPKMQAQLRAELEAGGYNPAKLQQLAEFYLSDIDEEEQAWRYKVKSSG